MIAILLLAAGNSSRMGRPKMLLPYKETTLLRYAAGEALKLAMPLVVVTGAHAEAIETELKKDGLLPVRNNDWPTGMASSIRTGLEYLSKKYPALDAVLIMVGDQPYLTADLLSKLIRQKEISGKEIAASYYAGTAGTPVIFDRKYFAALMALEGQQGAKKLLQQFADEVTTVDFPLGAVDIDSPEDYEKLK